MNEGPDIEALALSSQQGDRDAFGKLYDLFVKKIYNYIYFRTYRRDLSEDLTSLAFLKALEKLNTFKPDRGSFSAWLYRIAHNALMDHFRQRKGQVNLDDIWEVAGPANVETDAENRVSWEKLKPVMSKLSPRERDIILMRVWDGLSYKEIGDVLGSSEASCKMAYSRAVRYLKNELPLLLFIAAVMAEIPGTDGRLLWH